MPHADRTLIERELQRLAEERATLDREWQRLPHLSLTILLVGPLWWWLGSTVGIYALLCVPCFVGTAMYLVGVRRAENDRLRGELNRQLAKWAREAEGERAAASSPAEPDRSGE